MASVDSMTFDRPAYAPGDPITLTVGYTPDTASSMPQVFTATTIITNSAGAATATGLADFTVNVPQPGGDTLATSDTGGRAWTEESNSGTVAVFTATA